MAARPSKWTWAMATKLFIWGHTGYALVGTRFNIDPE